MRRTLYALLLAVLYFATAKLSLLAAIPPGYATAVWPPSGIALAALLLAGSGLWPGIWLGSFAVNLGVEGSLPAAGLIATGSTLQALATAVLVRRQIGVPRLFERVEQVLKFVGLVAAGAVIAPTLALLPLAALHPLPLAQLAANWWTWWQGDACGMLIFAPLVLSYTAPGIRWDLRRAAEAVLFAALLVAAGHLVFTGELARSFILVPFIVWAAFRFGTREVTTVSAAICLMALAYTLAGGEGRFTARAANETLLLLLVFVSTIVVTGLMLRAVLAQLEAARAELESRVRQSEERLRLMIESVVDYAIVMLDARGHVASWNAGAERLFGYGAAEIQGAPLVRLHAEPSDDRAARELEVAASVGHFEEEGWRRRKDGTRFLARAVLTPVRDERGALVGYAKVVQDLTERKRTEAELVHARVSAEQASQAKSQFLANMSHELRTPLNSMLILAKLLADNLGGNLTEKQVRFAQTIHASGLDLLSLINDLLDLAKIEAGAAMPLHVGPTPPADVAAELERLFRQLANEKRLEFSVEIAPDLPEVVRTDATRLKQVLKNLLANAFKFTPQGAVRLRIAPEGERAVAFSVSDTGIGIAPEKQQIIFEAFQQADGTTSRRYGGTGLGLSISQELARLLGGELRVASRPGEGSTFTFVLPLRDERVSAAA